jgi:[ribosomal protein S5]-alanine N-acetyltransferase
MSPSRVTAITRQRLALARFEDTDYDAVHDFSSDPEVCRYTTWGPNTDAETRAFIVGATKPTDAELQLAVMLDHEVIGSAAVWTTSASDRTGEFGYVISRRHWGQGYATEVARMLIELGFERLSLERLGATCHPDNEASIRVLEKCGMRREGHLRGHVLVRGQRRDSVIYGLLATDRTS